MFTVDYLVLNNLKYFEYKSRQTISFIDYTREGPQLKGFA